MSDGVLPAMQHALSRFMASPRTDRRSALPGANILDQRERASSPLQAAHSELIR
jgi:hypothetical protein